MRMQVNQFTLPPEAILIRRMHGIVAVVLGNYAQAPTGARSPRSTCTASHPRRRWGRPKPTSLPAPASGLLRCVGAHEEVNPMADHRIGTREEWTAAHSELTRLEAEQAERAQAIKRKRRELPWVPVEKEYVFATQDGEKTLAELFDGRSQLLAYNIMYGPDYTVGACPGCTNLADGFDATTLLHLNKRDVTMHLFLARPDRPAHGL